jgi:hypothetical protein
LAFTSSSPSLQTNPQLQSYRLQVNRKEAQLITANGNIQGFFPFHFAFDFARASCSGKAAAHAK